MSAIDPAEFGDQADDTPGMALPPPGVLALAFAVSALMWFGLYRLIASLLG